MFKSALVFLFVVALAQSSQLRHSFNKDNAKDFVFGVLLANRFMEKVPDLYPCVGDVTELKEAVQQAHDLFQQGGVDNVVHAVQGVADAFAALTHGCGDTAAEVVHYVEEVVAIVTAEDFKQNAEQALYTYAEQAGRDVAEFEKARRNDDYLTAGIRFGDIVSIAVWGEPNPELL